MSSTYVQTVFQSYQHDYRMVIKDECDGKLTVVKIHRLCDSNRVPLAL